MNGRALFTGIWMGLWTAMIGWSAWGIWYVSTHPAGSSSFVGWLDVAIFGPVLLIAMRLWKWIFTFALMGLGVHELHKLSQVTQLGVLFFGTLELQKPHNQERIEAYGRWLTTSEGPGALNADGRLLLRLGLVIGLITYFILAGEGFDTIRGLEAEHQAKAAAFTEAHSTDTP